MNGWVLGVTAALGLGALALRRFKPELERLLRPLGDAVLPHRETALDRNISALRSAVDPLERQRLLSAIVEESYQQRSSPAMNTIFRRFAALQIEELERNAESLETAGGGRLPEPPAFARLADAFEEEGRIAEALAVCDQARKLGVRDENQAGFSDRIRRLRRKIVKPRTRKPPAGRRRPKNPPSDS